MFKTTLDERFDLGASPLFHIYTILLSIVGASVYIGKRLYVNSWESGLYWFNIICFVLMFVSLISVGASGSTIRKNLNFCFAFIMFIFLFPTWRSGWVN